MDRFSSSLSNPVRSLSNLVREPGSIGITPVPPPWKEDAGFRPWSSGEEVDPGLVEEAVQLERSATEGGGCGVHGRPAKGNEEKGTPAVREVELPPPANLPHPSTMHGVELEMRSNGNA